MKRSSDPRTARWIITGRASVPSRVVYLRSNRSGIWKSSWMVPSCQSRSIASFTTKSIFGP